MAAVCTGALPQWDHHSWAIRQPFHLYLLHEETQNLHNVEGVDGNAPGDDVGVDQALAVKEGQNNLLGPAGLHPRFDGAWFSLLDPLFKLLFCLRSRVTHHGLIHSNIIVQHQKRVKRRFAQSSQFSWRFSVVFLLAFTFLMMA